MAKEKIAPKLQKKLSVEDRQALTEGARELLGHWMKIRDYLFLAGQYYQYHRYPRAR